MCQDSVSAWPALKSAKNSNTSAENRVLAVPVSVREMNDGSPSVMSSFLST